MPGTPWLTVDGSTHFRKLKDYGIHIEDREGIFPQIDRLRNDFDGLCSLSYYTLGDLGLPHGSTTPEIFDSADESGAKVVPYSIALRQPVEYTGAFKNNFFRRLFGQAVPFESCLLGVKPLVSARGRKYVVELAEKHFRFRLAGEEEHWGTNEYWVFAD